VDIDAALAALNKLVETKAEQVSELENEIAEIVDEIGALELIQQRLQGVVLNDPPDAAKWRGMARSDAVLAVLNEYGGTMTNSSILAALRAKGRTKDTANYVAATLQHLKGYSAVSSPARGVWSLTEMEVKSP
jgi:hypothetical protein